MVGPEDEPNMSAAKISWEETWKRGAKSFWYWQFVGPLLTSSSPGQNKLAIIPFYGVWLRKSDFWKCGSSGHTVVYGSHVSFDASCAPFIAFFGFFYPLLHVNRADIWNSRVLYFSSPTVYQLKFYSIFIWLSNLCKIRVISLCNFLMTIRFLLAFPRPYCKQNFTI
jgi:hypothetical protein